MMMKETHRARFDLPPGSLADMTCGVCTDGVNGVNRKAGVPTYLFHG